MDAPTEKPAMVPDDVAAAQLKLNVAHYAGIYKACLGEAAKLIGPDDELVVKVAGDMFRQFCEDQAQVAGDQMQTDRMKKAMGPVLEFLQRRGAYI